MYIILTASETEVRNRKTNDRHRNRRNFEKHMKMINPQLHCFKAVQLFMGRVLFLEAKTIQENTATIQKYLSKVTKYPGIEAISLFKIVIRFLKENKA
jgi:hypothetical protein